jgi:hypothetical protein
VSCGGGGGGSSEIGDEPLPEEAGTTGSVFEQFSNTKTQTIINQVSSLELFLII